MKKLCAFMLLLLSTVVWAEDRYSLTVLGDYGFNKTYGSSGSLDVIAVMPVNQHVELQAAAQLNSANLYTVEGLVRPKFPLPVGELFVEAELFYRSVKRVELWDFVTALSLGYRMDYVSLQVGLYSRVMGVNHREWHSETAFNSEPFNMLYRLQINTRPATENWNLWLALSNKDDFQFERVWAPFVQLGAHYDVNSHWRVLVDSELKLSGMFHLNAEFYSAYVRAGFAYRF